MANKPQLPSLIGGICWKLKSSAFATALYSRRHKKLTPNVSKVPITLCLARPKVAPYDLPVELPVQLATGGLSQHVVDELQGPGCSNKNLARRPDAGRCSCVRWEGSTKRGNRSNPQFCDLGRTSSIHYSWGRSTLFSYNIQFNWSWRCGWLTMKCCSLNRFPVLKINDTIVQAIHAMHNETNDYDDNDSDDEEEANHLSKVLPVADDRCGFLWTDRRWFPPLGAVVGFILYPVLLCYCVTMCCLPVLLSNCFVSYQHQGTMSPLVAL